MGHTSHDHLLTGSSLPFVDNSWHGDHGGMLEVFVELDMDFFRDVLSAVLTCVELFLIPLSLSFTADKHYTGHLIYLEILQEIK